MDSNNKKARGSRDGKPSPILNRASATLASRLGSSSIEVKGISRKEFKPTIPARRKKHNVPAAAVHGEAAVEKQEAKREERHFEEPSKAFEQKLKDRISGKQKERGPKPGKKEFKRKEYVRSSTGLFGGNDPMLDGEDPFASVRTAAELEEEKYIDPFHQSASELTPVTLPINPRIDSKSKLLVGKGTDTRDLHQETHVSELLYRAPDDTTESTYLFNLPDSLPVDMARLKVSSESEGGEEETEMKKPTIHNLPEGYLGRLQILRSGRARLMIGEVPFDVCLNSKSGFLQEILCCQTQALDRGIVANIGTVPYSLSVSPEFNKLIT